MPDVPLIHFLTSSYLMPLFVCGEKALHYLATTKLFRQNFATTCLFMVLYKYFKLDMHQGMYPTVSLLTGVVLTIAMA